MHTLRKIIHHSKHHREPDKDDLDLAMVGKSEVPIHACAQLGVIPPPPPHLLPRRCAVEPAAATPVAVAGAGRRSAASSSSWMSSSRSSRLSLPPDPIAEVEEVVETTQDGRAGRVCVESAVAKSSGDTGSMEFSNSPGPEGLAPGALRGVGGGVEDDVTTSTTTPVMEKGAGAPTPRATTPRWN